jgi:2-polyprenyl-3-methyl-5-hydroxy-6-metoxy-1,4-benzoquinol methylase
MSTDLTDAETHFRFGENWASYAEMIDDTRVEDAVKSVRELVGDLDGRSFLDIGSGSGLFSAAALRLGAARVLAVDIDEASVATTRKVLTAQGSGDWRAELISVFDLPSRVSDRFDVVYSWGVLHHTGEMWRAIEAAASMVAEGGTFAFALYEKTALCGAWRYEKRVYRKLPSAFQKVLRSLYVGVWGAGMLAKGHNPVRKIKQGQERGMDVFHDVHDWMGGYPYESTTKTEVTSFMRGLGFEPVLDKRFRVLLGGVLGSGCSEYVFRKTG